jgi:adenine-specific DNA-methyltransferase
MIDFSDMEENYALMLRDYKEKIHQFYTVEKYPNAKNNVFFCDNYKFLKLVSEKRKLYDMIYIDPPYNTHVASYSYSDDYEDMQEYLQFMFNRLWLAVDLLADDGLMFISIDEHAYAYLKVMCDYIFKPVNYLGDFVRDTRTPINVSKCNFSVNHEYCMVYAKDKNKVRLNGDNKDLDKKFKYKDDRGQYCYICVTSRCKPGEDAYYKVTNPITHQYMHPPAGRAWCFSEKRFNELINDGHVEWAKRITKAPCFKIKKYRDEIDKVEDEVTSLHFINKDFRNTKGTKEIKEFFGFVPFTFVKPIKFIYHLIDMAVRHKPYAKICDFFAGSCTTACAAMLYNCEHRDHYITYDVCTLPEPLPERSELRHDYLIRGMEPYSHLMAQLRLKKYATMMANRYGTLLKPNKYFLEYNTYDDFMPKGAI